MKKVFAGVLALMVALALSSSVNAFMRRDMGLVKGRVIMNDPTRKMITVDGERGEGKVDFDISAAEITTNTSVGERVVVIYMLDTGKATWVKEVPPGR